MKTAHEIIPERAELASFDEILFVSRVLNFKGNKL